MEHNYTENHYLDPENADKHFTKQIIEEDYELHVIDLILKDVFSKRKDDYIGL